ncbi:MAG: hypothetical protein HFJ30_00305 [Clostridia bacterium]|jgi:hypothetical protein|nr:hypothetical protein [Clostridia bacterium]
MRIPKVISKNNREYIFVKKYPSHYSYQEMNVGYRESFLLQDLVQIKNNVKISKNIKPERDRYF